MKSSRAMLLAALLFAVPAFANETAPAEGQTEQTSNEPAKVEPKKEEGTKEADTSKKDVASETNVEPKKEEGAKEANTSKTEETPAKEEEKEGLFATALKYGKMPFVAVLATAPDYIAQKTLGNIAAMECLKGGKLAEFLNNKWTGRSAVFGSAALITYMVWNATQSEDVDADDSDVMFE